MHLLCCLTMKIQLPTTNYSYDEYKAMIEALHSEGKVTGVVQSESLLEYSKLNMHRMQRWDKTFIPSAELVRSVVAIDKPLHWIIITEGWCGDAAQQIPVIEKLAELNPMIQTRYILRDENPETMDLFLTNGSKSIPVWICTDQHWNLLWKWGPRTVAASEMLQSMKEKGVDESTLKQELHTWYARNKHESFQQEIGELVRSLIATT
jgi:Thioredoxin